MARQRKKPQPEQAPGAPLWMVTYSDMVTLLLTFFLMLMAMANFQDIGRVQAVLESIKTALGVGGFNARLMAMDTERAYQITEVDRPDDLMPVMSELRAALARHVSDNLVRMTSTRTEIRVAIDERVLFAPGSTDIHPAAYSLLTELADVLSRHEVDVIAEGHSDATGELGRNWELSAARAAAVVSVLQTKGGIDGRRLEIRGYGQFRPATISAGGASKWDRRVELVIEADHRSALPAVQELDRFIGGNDGW